MSESQQQDPQAGEKTASTKSARPSILHKLDLLLHSRRDSQELPNSHKASSCSAISYFQCAVELICLSASFALEVWRIDAVSECFSDFAEYRYSVLVAFCAIFATLSKVLISLMRLPKRVQSLVSEVRLSLWKAVVATSYCSHNLPILLVDADDCRGNSHIFAEDYAGVTAVQWLVVGWYSVLVGVSIALCILTKCFPKSFATMRNSESGFWCCVRVAQALAAVFSVFTLVVMASLLDSGIGVVYAEFAATIWHLLHAAYLLLTQKSGEDQQKT